MSTNNDAEGVRLSRVGATLLSLTFIAIGAIAAYFFQRPGYTFLPGYGEKMNGLDFAEARDMVQFATETANTATDDGQALGNPKAIYFALGPLYKYLDAARALDADGVRLYFGRYKKSVLKKTIDWEGKEIENDYILHSTVIFVPTKRDGHEIKDMVDPSGHGGVIFQPYNGGISCPPLPPRNCDHQLLGQ